MAGLSRGWRRRAAKHHWMTVVERQEAVRREKGLLLAQKGALIDKLPIAGISGAVSELNPISHIKAQVSRMSSHFQTCWTACDKLFR